MQLYDGFQERERYGGDNAGLRSRTYAFHNLESPSRGVTTHHCHKMRTAVTSSTGEFKGFYHCEYIGYTFVGARALTVDIEELVLRRDE